MVSITVKKVDAITTMNAYYNRNMSHAIAVTFATAILLVYINVAFDMDVYFVASVSMLTVVLGNLIIFEAALSGFSRFFEQVEDDIEQILKNGNDFLVFGETIVVMKDGKAIGEIGIRSTSTNKMLLVLSGPGIRNKRELVLGPVNDITKVVRNRFGRHLVRRATDYYVPVTSQ